jgi:hypothetical protein
VCFRVETVRESWKSSHHQIPNFTSFFTRFRVTACVPESFWSLSQGVLEQERGKWKNQKAKKKNLSLLVSFDRPITRTRVRRPRAIQGTFNQSLQCGFAQGSGSQTRSAPKQNFEEDSRSVGKETTPSVLPVPITYQYTKKVPVPITYRYQYMKKI